MEAVVIQMAIQISEVDLSILVRAGTQSLVVLVVPPLLMTRLLLPVDILRHGEEGLLRLGVLWITLPHLDDWSDEDAQEVGDS